MNVLRKIKISQRIWIILLVALVSMTLLALAALATLKAEYRQAEITKATHLVESAHTLFGYYHARELAGEMTGAEARTAALEALRAMRSCIRWRPRPRAWI